MKTEDRGPKTEYRQPAAVPGARPDGYARGELCDFCGTEALKWRKCKLICEQCGNIVKSCADL